MVPTVVDVGGRHVVKRLVIALVVVAGDEVPERCLQCFPSAELGLLGALSYETLCGGQHPEVLLLLL